MLETTEREILVPIMARRAMTRSSSIREKALGRSMELISYDNKILGENGRLGNWSDNLGRVKSKVKSSRMGGS